MYTREAPQHGKPLGVVSDDQPDAREGQAGRFGVAERPVVPRKPGNAGGGKGPQFKVGTESGKVQEIGELYKLRLSYGSCGRHHRLK